MTFALQQLFTNPQNNLRLFKVSVTDNSEPVLCIIAHLLPAIVILANTVSSIFVYEVHCIINATTFTAVTVTNSNTSIKIC